MPQIPTLQNQVRTEAAPNIQQRPLQSTAAESIGQGLRDVGNVVFKVRQEEALKADRAAFMDADRHTDTIANDLITNAQQLQGKDAIGSAPKLLEQFDKSATETEAGLTSRRAKAVYRESVNARRAQLQRQLDSHEGQQREAYYAKSREDFKDQAHINAVTQFTDPKAIESEIEKIRSAIAQSPGMDDAQKATEFGVRRSGVYTGVVSRYLANDQIGAAEKYYKSIKDNVNGDKAAFIENAITDAKRAAEARLRTRQDHAEAIAERTLNAIDRQISSGVPARPEMWAAWENKVRGTSFADEFKERVETEREIQDTLRKPLTEQVRLVQERQTALKKGGSVAEAANVQRLTNAVKQNIAQIRNEPLLFAEQRLETPAEPIDFSRVTDPAARVENAAIFGQRDATLRTVSKQFGVPVPMKPLLPQEVAQFTDMLNSASPQQATELFAGLRDQTGSFDIFKGAMQQVAPDAPVKVMAGLLAAQKSELASESHWFSPDLRALGSKDVSATMLAGDALLNPSKSEKGDDGKPKTKQLLLPPAAQAGLQDAFAKTVGNVFALRPDAANDAYQAVQAYYVGRASELGQLAGDSQAVNQNLVREAVRATLGNVVDFNDNGGVLAPWGMGADDFEERVATSFAAEAKRRGISGDITPETSSFGLVNANSEGLYGVTIGKNHNLLLDAKGNPVTINLKPPDPHDARGYIDRSAP